MTMQKCVFGGRLKNKSPLKMLRSGYEETFRGQKKRPFLGDM